MKSSLKGNNFNSHSKSKKTNSKVKDDSGERRNNFASKDKLGIKTGVY